MSRMNKNSPSHFEQLESRQLMSGGQFDTTLGQGGKTIAEVGFTARHSAVQPDGKTVLVGQSGNRWLAARLTTSGALDPTFGGGDGLAGVTINDGAVDQIAVQNDGKIVLGGAVNGWSLGPNDKFMLVRLNSDGSLDRTFDGDGKASAVGGLNMFNMSDLVIQPDGKLVMTGGDREEHIGYKEADFVVARMLPNGKLDPTFGDINFPSYTRKGWTRTAFGGNDVPTSIAIAPDGKIVVAGTRHGDDESGPGDYRFLAARYHTNGTLDRSFDGDGKVSTDMVGNNRDQAKAVVVQSDGKVIVGGMARYQFAMVRYNPNGSIDRSFGGGRFSNGIVYTRLSQRQDEMESMFLDSRNRIVAVGTADKNYNLNYVGKRVGIAQYRLTGALDTTFGDNGIAAVETGNIRVLSAAKAPNSKIVICGYQGANTTTVARVHQQIAKVDVYDVDRTANETGDTSGSIRVSRDDIYSFPTRVYLDVQGSALRGADYTAPIGTARMLDGVDREGLPRLSTRNYIDIPAGARSIDLPISAINDQLFERTETAAFSIVNDPSYVRGFTNTAAVSITDMAEVVHVNFQRAASPVASQTADTGLVYGDRGNGQTFGWDADNAANARIRGNSASPDFRYDSLSHMQKDGANRKWEMAVPNGVYEVRVVAGDPSNTDGVYRMNVEDTLAVAGTPTGDTRWFRGTVRVNVTDGRLTISNAAGAINNRICFVDVLAAYDSTGTGAIFSSTPVRQYSAATASTWHQTPSGLFADNQIDDQAWSY